VAARLVVLVSGTGTNLQALLDAAADPGTARRWWPPSAPTVPASRGWTATERAGVPTFVHRLRDFPGREPGRVADQQGRRVRADLIVSRAS